MDRDRFVETRRVRWERLEALVKRGQRGGLGRLSGEEVLELGRLYRASTSDLAVALRDYPGDRVGVYLNGLVARAHPLVYRGPVMDVARIGRFVRYGFPATYRAAGRYIAVAFGIFALAALISALIVAQRPSMANVLLPGTAQSLRSVMQQHHLWVKSATENHSVAANFIMLNNIQVAFFAFAGGMLLGVGTIYVLATNGIMFGTIATMVAQYGLSAPFWAFVAPHGVIELSVIFMAGGAGLMIGDAILRPGLVRRRDALAQAARHAAYLLLGCVPLLVIAGTIEGFLSPSDVPDGVKIAVATVAGVLLYTYLLFSRPRRRQAPYTFADTLLRAVPGQTSHDGTPIPIVGEP